MTDIFLPEQEDDSPTKVSLTEDSRLLAGQKIGLLTDNMETVIKGKKEQIQLLLTALLAGGHVLMEDNPGTGKTVMAKTLAQSIAGEAQSVYFPERTAFLQCATGR